MSIAEKLHTIAENERRVYEAGKHFLRARVDRTLTTLTAEDLAGVTKIGQNSLSYLPLRTLTLPDGLTSIERSGISYCEYLKSILIPEGVRKIGYGAFNGCWALKSIELPSTVESIDSYAFNAGNGINLIIHATIPPTIQSNSFTVAQVASITVPNGCGEAYRTATNWSALADVITEAEE